MSEPAADAASHNALRVHHVTFDCRDPQALAAWWAAYSGGQVADDWGGFVRVRTPGFGVEFLAFQRVDDPTPGKNRVHLDLTAGANRPSEVARAVTMGARVVAEHEQPPGFRWVVLEDPAGNVFCVSD